MHDLATFEDFDADVAPLLGLLEYGLVVFRVPRTPVT
jgi:hypothetical protein